MPSKLAIITWVDGDSPPMPPSGGVPTPPIYYPPEVWPPLPGQPPGIWPSPGHPAHPIAPGGPPPIAGWTPPGFHPSHPIAPGGPPPVAAPPIYFPPGQPPVIWPGPGYPAHPIAPGGPPPEVWPTPPEKPPGGGQSPPVIWPSPGHPAHPIVIPEPPDDPAKWEVKAGWSPLTGWVIVIIPVGANVPTPSAAKKP